VIAGATWSRTVAGPVIHRDRAVSLLAGQPEHLGAERREQQRHPGALRCGQGEVSREPSRR
jgi:hypothetical protein